jgi:ubiquinone/menaquinone biosynthesis C-methylase UbiE
MSEELNLNEYKQELADLYSGRSDTYDDGDWHPRIAHRLVEYARISQGQHILDIATGTGMAAIEAGQLVGSEGRVIGVDISDGMLAQARRKVEALGLTNINFEKADAEALNFSDNCFDRILCSSALIWMEDISSALRHWYRFLKPGGLFGFHAFAETAFIGGVITCKVAEKYGISYAMNKPTGTIEKCQDLVQKAGFEAIEIKTEQDGSYISLEQAKQMWAGTSHPAPGQFPNPLLQLSSEKLEEVKAEFDRELEALKTEQGIWNDITIFYIFGQK